MKASTLNLSIFPATNDFEIGLYLQVCNYRFFDANIFQPFGQAELIFIQISGYVKLSVSLWEFMAAPCMSPSLSLSQGIYY